MQLLLEINDALVADTIKLSRGTALQDTVETLLYAWVEQQLGAPVVTEAERDAVIDRMMQVTPVDSAPVTIGHLYDSSNPASMGLPASWDELPGGSRKRIGRKFAHALTNRWTRHANTPTGAATYVLANQAGGTVNE